MDLCELKPAWSTERVSDSQGYTEKPCGGGVPMPCGSRLGSLSLYRLCHLSQLLVHADHVLDLQEGLQKPRSSRNASSLRNEEHWSVMLFWNRTCHPLQPSSAYITLVSFRGVWLTDARLARLCRRRGGHTASSPLI